MRKAFAVIGLLQVAGLIAPPSGSAATLPGFPFNVWHNPHGSR